jgi:type IV pilus assembly protein PilO
MALTDQIDLTPILSRLERLPGPQRYVVLGLVAVAVAGLYWFLFYGAKQTELEVLDRKLTKIEADVVKSRAVAANFKTFMKELDELKARLNQAVQRLPDSTELPGLLTDITSLGKKTGLEFRSFRPKKEVKRGFYAEVPIDIELRGTYHNIGVFFDKVAHLPRIVRISKVSMNVAEEAKDPPVLRVKGVAQTFRFVEQSETGTGGE